MKKNLTGVCAFVIAVASYPITTLAADNSVPVTKNGERLQYNKPYYVKDKNFPHKGGVTFEHWGLDDYVLFAHAPTDNGTPIIFENKNRTDGIIQSDDWIRIKFMQANASGDQYWAPDQLMSSVYLSSDDRTDHKIYGLSTDNSIGIGIFFRNSLGQGNWTKEFWEYKGIDAEKSWVQRDKFWIEPPVELPPLHDRKTPFEIISAKK